MAVCVHASEWQQKRYTFPLLAAPIGRSTDPGSIQVAFVTLLPRVCDLFLNQLSEWLLIALPGINSCFTPK